MSCAGCEWPGQDVIVPGPVATDVAALDIAAGDIAAGDAAAGDADGQLSDAAAACPGGARCPCSAAAPCDDSVCVPSPQGPRCATPCSAGCDESERCTAVTDAGATLALCTPAWGLLCRPCTDDSGCAVPGVALTACVSYGAAGSFCGAGCDTDAACPTGYRCGSATTVGGLPTKQCVRASDAGGDALGTCPCSDAARTFQLSTACTAAGGPGGKLQCKGFRTCGPQGLGPCEPLAGPAAACSDASCLGKADGAACDDGEACTEGDTCAAGQCAPGKLACACLSDSDCAKKEDGDLCNGTLYCDTSGATPACKVNPATVVTCASSADTACRANQCNPATGLCAMTSAAAKTPCNDGDDCSVNDACDGAGTCVGGLGVCPCSADSDCAKKEDGDLCNGTLYCDLTTGSCKLNPSTVVTCASANDTSCSVNTCAKSTGVCSMQATKDGAVCDDDNACTVGDTCAAGACVSGTFTCPCKVDADCASKDNGTVCDGTLVCDASVGQCVHNPASVVVCPTAADTACVKNTCHPVTGVCTPVPVQGALLQCSDGNPCTTGDTCAKGLCVGGTNTCDCAQDADCAKKEDGNLCNGTLFCNKTTGKCQVNPATAVTCPTVDNTACSQSVCQPKTGKCLTVLSTDGAPCDADDSSCTAGDACVKGVCKAGTQVCDCTQDSDCASKEDGDACNGTLYCDKSGPKPSCEVNPATVVTCPTAGDTACVKSLCQPKTGTCAKVTLADGAPCGDGETCTQTLTCAKGVCVASQTTCPCKVAADCSKFMQAGVCQQVVCDPSQGCQLVTTKAGCDDGDACTVGETCAAGSCGGGQAKACDDGKPCTTDSCDKAKGCVTVANTAACDDGDACTTGDACAAGACKGGKATVCDDSDACTTDSCDKAKGCVNAPGASCDDNNVCTTDSCDKAKGCVNAPASGPCDDGDACTAGEVCVTGQCVAGPPKNCDDGNVCTKDSCDKAKGCASAATAGSCDDGDACTEPDACDKGACKGGAPKGCDDKNPCTTDSCEAKTGCTSKANAQGCDDGDPCTTGDACAGGKCAAGKPKSCDDSKPETVDSCDKATGKCVNVGGGGGDEVKCDGLDDNSDGITDGGCDDDGDGYCNKGMIVVGTPAICPKGGGDCDDSNPIAHSGMPELCTDGVDNDCDGSTDEGCDGDKDGYCAHDVWIAEGSSCGKEPTALSACQAVDRGTSKGAKSILGLTVAAKPKGGFMPFYGQLWTVKSDTGDVDTVNLTTKAKGTVSTKVARLHSLVGAPRSPTWYGTVPGVSNTPGLSPKGAVVRVVGHSGLAWRTEDVGVALHGVALLGEHVVTTSVGDAPPKLYRLSQRTGTLVDTVTLKRSFGTGPFVATAGLAATRDRVWLTDSGTSTQLRGYPVGTFVSDRVRTVPAETALLFRVKGTLCGFYGKTTDAQCQHVASWECRGSDCDDSAKTVHPGATEAVGDNVDNDCDGSADQPKDIDGDGVCAHASCATQAHDACPGVWDPLNDPESCSQVTGALPHETSLGLSAGVADTKLPRVNEPVEVPLANGASNDDVLAHWWFANGKLLSEGEHAATLLAGTPIAGPFGDFKSGLSTDGKVAIDGVVGTEASWHNGTLPSTATIGGWFKPPAKVGSPVLVELASIAIWAELRLVGQGSSPGKAVALVHTDKGSVQIESTSALTSGWHHMAAVVQAQRLTLYVDGVVAADTTFTGALGGSALSTFTAGGADTNSDGKPDASLFAGGLGEVLLHQRALTPAEIHAWATSKAVYGSRRVAGALPSYADVRLVEGSGASAHHVPYAMVGARPMAVAAQPTLAALWRLDGDGTEALSGTKSTLSTIAGARTGRFGRAKGAIAWLPVGGPTQALTHGKTYDIASGFTLEAWVRLARDKPGSGTLFRLEGPGKISGSQSGLQNLSVTLSSDAMEVHGLNEMKSWSAVGGKGKPKATLPRGVWTHVAVVVDGAVVRTYVGGLLKTSVESGAIAEGLGKGVSSATRVDTVLIGGPQPKAVTNVGLTVDELALHTSALSSAAIRDRALGLPRVRFLATSTFTKAGNAFPMRDYRLQWGGAAVLRPHLQARRADAAKPEACWGLFSACFGLRGLWTARHSPEATLLDLGPSAYHGRSVGSPPRLVAGPAGAAVAFQDKNLVDVSAAAFAALQNLTVDFRLAQAKATDATVLFAGPSQNPSIHIRFPQGATVGASFFDKGLVNAPADLSKWSAYAVVRDGSVCKVYDKSAPFTDLATSSQLIDPVKAGVSVVSIGGKTGAPASTAYDGPLGILRVSDRALTGVETLRTQPMTAHAAWDAGGFVQLPTGRIRQGCNQGKEAGCKAEEGPARVVWVSRFGVRPTEVSVAEYTQCVTAGRCDGLGPGGTFGSVASPSPALNQVTWAQCQDYCRYAGGEVVSEAQWERAARAPCAYSVSDASCLSTLNARYPWPGAGVSCKEANLGLGGTCPGKVLGASAVPQAGVSPNGVLGLAGNVAEWARDVYAADALSKLPAVDPLATGAGGAHTRRGGAWNSKADASRIVSRAGQQGGNIATGCRCAAR